MFDKFRQSFLNFLKKIPRISIDGQFAEMLIIVFLVLFVARFFIARRKDGAYRTRSIFVLPRLQLLVLAIWCRQPKQAGFLPPSIFWWAWEFCWDLSMRWRNMPKTGARWTNYLKNKICEWKNVYI